jgi:LacI family transcriptional regulator
MLAEKGKVTIYDVARRAGVAISTVSRVLNNSPDVSDRTRIRVERAIEDLNYRPDRTAKSLAQQERQMLAVALPSFTSPFHNELLKGIRSALRKTQLDLLLSDLGSKLRENSLFSFLQRGAVGGLLLAGVQIDERIATELKALQSPVVLIGGQWPAFDGFMWDETAGAQQAVSHLLSLGHRRIGMIRIQRDSRNQVLRITGYQSALRDAGIEFDPSLIVSGETEKHAGFSEEAGYEAMNKLLAADPDLTAVFASSDVQAIGAWAAITESGRRVPEDIALVGYDDIKTSRYIGLSSIDQSMQKIGENATELLLSRLSGSNKEPARTTIIKPVLRVRRSSGIRRTVS